MKVRERAKVRTMAEKDTEKVEEREKVLVPVRRHKATKEAEPEICEKPRAGKQWETPRRWYVY